MQLATHMQEECLAAEEIMPDPIEGCEMPKTESKPESTDRFSDFEFDAHSDDEFSSDRPDRLLN